MSALAGRLPESIQDFGLLVGLALCSVGLISSAYHCIKCRWSSNRLEPSHLIIIGLAGVFVFSGVALAGIVWQQASKPVAVAASWGTSKTTPATVNAPEPPKTITNPHDIPKKLEIIDSFLVILQSDIPKQVDGMRLLAHTWDKKIQPDQRAAYIAEILAFREVCKQNRDKIQELRQKHPQFEDIGELLDQRYETPMFDSLSKYEGAIGAFGEKGEIPNPGLVLTPFIENVMASASDLQRWKDDRYGKALELRKQLAAVK